MLIFSGLVVWALMVAAESGIGPSTNSSFCTESRECLEYELVCKTDQYEVRHYSPTRWVSTDAEAYFLGVGAAMAFRRLFQYITGANHLGLQMEMTAPVLVRVPEETRVWEPAVYTLSFLLPSAYQDNPPSPTNEKLYFTDMPDLDVYVRGYGGWMLSVSSRLHAHLLSQHLQLLHAPYNLSYHYGVGYDSPLKLLNRHNEVWYIAEGDVVCNDSQDPTFTHTPSDTPTHTPTHTPSDTPTHTPSHTPSDTPTHTPSHTPTDTPSNTPTHTPSNTPSDTPTHTPSDTPTHTPTQEPSDTTIHTPTHTLSDTPSHTPTNTPTHTPSQSEANSPMPSRSHPPPNLPSSPSHPPPNLPSSPSHTPSSPSPSHTPSSPSPSHTPSSPSHTPSSPSHTPSSPSHTPPSPLSLNPSVSDPSSDQPGSDAAAWTTPDP